MELENILKRKDVSDDVKEMIRACITEHKQVKEALHQAEHILSSSSDMLALLDQHFNYLTANKAYLAAFNLTLKQLLGHTVAQVFGEEFFCTVIKPNADRCLRGEKVNYQAWFDFPATGRRYMDIWYYPYYGGDNKIFGFVVNSRNITERKLAEDRLIESENKLRSISNNAVDAIFVKDRDRRYTFVNQAMQKMLGLPEDGILGKTPEEIFGPEQGDIIKEVDDRTFSGETVNEVRSLIIENREYFFHTLQTPFKVEEGVVTSIMGIVRDITERKLAEEALRESEKSLKEAQKIAHIGSFDFDLKTQKVNGSDELFNIFGFTREEVNFQSFVDAVNPEDKKYDLSHIQRAIDAGESYDIEHRLRCKNGREKVVRTKGKAIINKKGKTIRLIGTVQDITERKKSEEELQKMQKIESIGVLAGGIAHDFNNLLNGVMGNINIARMLIEDKEAVEKLKEAEKILMQASHLTHQLLTFSKGGAPIKEAVEPEAMIKESASFALTGSNIKLKYNFKRNKLSVYADKGQLRQVIQNIVINAKQAMPKGGVIQIYGEDVLLEKGNQFTLKEGEYIKIVVKDNGIGISPENLSKIFDPYFSLKAGGSGLGLAVVFSIIKKHNGYIKADSELEKGTTFEIYIPAVNERKDKKEERKIVDVISGRGKVLLMDDEEYIRNLFREGLFSIGFKIETASSGEEAVELYKEARQAGNPFDLVVLDVTVKGGMGGIDTVKELKKIDPNLKAIAISGYATDSIIANPEKYGFMLGVTKPCSQSNLAALINQLLKQNISEEIELAKKIKILVMDDEKGNRDSFSVSLSLIGCEVEVAEEGLEAINLYQEALSSGNPYDIVLLDLLVNEGMGGVDTVKELHKINPDIKAIAVSGDPNSPAIINPKKHGFCRSITKPCALKDLALLLDEVGNRSR